jgi:hypothetical protein
MVTTGNRVMGIEQIAQLPGHGRQLVECHTTIRAVDEQAQDEASCLGAVLDVHHLQACRQGERLR